MQFIPVAIAIFMVALVILPITLSIISLPLGIDALITLLLFFQRGIVTRYAITTATQILAYDLWRQRKPLRASDNTFAPQQPQTTIINNGYPEFRPFE